MYLALNTRLRSFTKHLDCILRALMRVNPVGAWKLRMDKGIYIGEEGRSGSEGGEVWHGTWPTRYSQHQSHLEPPRLQDYPHRIWAQCSCCWAQQDLHGSSIRSGPGGSEKMWCSKLGKEALALPPCLLLPPWHHYHHCLKLAVPGALLWGYQLNSHFITL